MGSLILFYIAVCLGILAGAVMGWVAIFRLTSLSDRMTKLERQVQSLAQLAAGTPSAEAPRTPPPRAAQAASVAATPVSRPASDAVAARGSAASPAFKAAQSASSPEHWLSKNIKTHWMIWLGGICIGLAGIFLAKHSIEQGLLGPGARITLTIVTALALHGVAEYLRRRTGNAAMPSLPWLGAPVSCSTPGSSLACIYTSY